MGFIDFAVRWDSETESEEELTDRIFYSVFIKNRLKMNKPCKISLRGDSGEGKSRTGAYLIRKLLHIQGRTDEDVLKSFEIMNIYEPRQYGRKTKSLIYDKEHKKANVACIHEARDIVSSRNWQNFIGVAIVDVNQQARAVKRLITIVISQDWSDVTKDMRKTFNFSMRVKRERGKPPKLYVEVIWKDERDLENIKIKKRRLMGYIIDNKGRYRKFIPQYFTIPNLPKHFIEMIDRQDREAKQDIIAAKLDKVTKEIDAEYGDKSEKVEQIVKHYTKDMESLLKVGKKRKNKFVLSKDFKKMHDLTQRESEMVEQSFNDKVEEMTLKVGLNDE